MDPERIIGWACAIGVLAAVLADIMIQAANTPEPAPPGAAVYVRAHPGLHW